MLQLRHQLLGSWQRTKKAKYGLFEPALRRMKRKAKYKTSFIAIKYALQVNTHVPQLSHLYDGGDGCQTLASDSGDQLKQNLLSSSEGRGMLSVHRQDPCKSKEFLLLI